MPSRRDFIKVGSGSALALLASPALSPGPPLADPRYPVITVAPLQKIGRGVTLPFAYPDSRSPALLIRLMEPALGGVGPDREIVAYSTLCTHKGCPVAYKAERKLMICPCHWSTFDPAKAGTLVIGQASQPLPQIELRIEKGLVQAVGVSGLVYGRHTNIL